MRNSKIQRCFRPQTEETQNRSSALLWVLLLTVLLIVMILQQWKLCLTVIICSAVSLLVRTKFEHNLKSYEEAQAQSQKELIELFEESAAGHKVIRLSRAESVQKASFSSRNQTYYEADRKMSLCSLTAHLIVPICCMIGTVIILSVSSIMTLHGHTNKKTAVLFLCYFYLISFLIERLNASRQKHPIVYSPKWSIVSEEKHLLGNEASQEKRNH